MKKALLLVASHALMALVGFVIGIYILPIWTAPPAPAMSDVKAVAERAEYTGQFTRDLKDSDAFHWGNGTVFIGRNFIALQGKLAPGPDYKLYLSPEFLETEADFDRIKPSMVRIGDVKTFENFIVPIPTTVDPSKFNTVVVWCESFSQFITAARYR